MKYYFAIPSLLVLGVGAAIIWTGPQAGGSESEPEEAARQMERDQAEIAARVSMSAPMEAENVDGVDPVQEAIQKGIIIEATLEEVEAALAAAAATPDPQDDLRALELKHRGSYRFFPRESDSAE